MMKNAFQTLLIVCALSCLMTAAYAAPSVKVRAGIHDRYNRIVFDWPTRTEYTVQQNNDTVTLQFNKPANAQLSSVNAVNPPLIRNLKQENTAKGLRVTFQVPIKARIESFRSGQGLAFDVLKMDQAAPKFADASNAAPAVAPAKETPPAAAETPKAEEPEVQELAKVESTPTAEKEAETTFKPAPQEPAKSSSPRLQTLADRLAEKPPEQELTSSSSSTASEERKSDAAIQGTMITLDPSEMTKLASFVRAGKLWLVLDKPLKDLSPDIKGEQLDLLSKNAKRIDLPKATAFVFDAPNADTVYSIRRIQNKWQIALNPADKPFLPDDIAINIVESKDSALPSVTLYAGENATVTSIKDTAIGDRLWVVPVRAPEGRIAKERITPSYKIMSTLMGAVIIPQQDAVNITTKDELVIISADAGKPLSLSNPEDRAKGIEDALQIPLFDLNIPGLKSGKFSERRQALETELVAQKSPDKKADVLLNLVRLNIQNGFGQEATGLLRIANNTFPSVTSMREYEALCGMAAALSGDIDQAKADLNSDALQSQPAAKLWMGYAYANNKDWKHAQAAFAETGNVVNSFPPMLKPRLILAKALSALETGDIAAVDQELKKIDRATKLNEAEKAAQEYISATSALLAKDKESSLPVYEELIKGKDQLYKVKAQLALIAQQLIDKKTTLDKAIKALERLRFDWRGDRLEIEILTRLGQYYVDNKQYAEGLTIWRQAAGLSQDTESTDAITEAMQKTFSDLYVKGDADKLSMLQALSLYEQFRELTPPGNAGNVALLRLADRLASADLLDQADILLEKQLHQNATGEQAAMMGAKLASWRLLNSNPSGALKALDESTQDASIPETLSQKRLLLRARALADVNKTQESLALLNTVNTPEAYSLKADVNWRHNRWGDAVDALQSLVSLYREQGKTAVDGPMPPLILKMAIALALDDNQKGLELLIAQYGEFMATTSKAQAFNILSKPSRGSTLADLDTLKNQVGEVELFQSFLKNFGK
jgi:hypothetical protein